MKLKNYLLSIHWMIIGFIIYSPSLIAQGEIMEANVSASLESVLILNIDPDIQVEFGIVEVAENIYQLSKQPDDVHFSIESTGNWNLSISATNNYFTSVDDSSSKIPIDFVGYFIENKGTNWDNGLFSDIANRTKDTILSLRQQKTTVLVNGNKNNIGGSDQNAFVLRWKLNFEDDLIKMDQFSNLNIKEGYYKANFYLTLSETDNLSVPQ